jgi:hypothetical protein
MNEKADFKKVSIKTDDLFFKNKSGWVTSVLFPELLPVIKKNPQ